MVDKIGYVRPTSPLRSTRRTGSVGASGFGDALTQAQGALGAEETTAPTTLSNVQHTQSLVGFQEVDADESRRREAFKRGRLTLDALSQVRDALLLGELPIATLERLEKLVATERSQTTDPTLNAILDEIELRAAVELAKLEVALRG